MVKFYVQLISFSLVKALHVILTAICITWAKTFTLTPILSPINHKWISL